MKHTKIPLAIAQISMSFRNRIIPRAFIILSRECELIAVEFLLIIRKKHNNSGICTR
jgi:glycyl-tRNA synthetase (class II)